MTKNKPFTHYRVILRDPENKVIKTVYLSEALTAKYVATILLKNRPKGYHVTVSTNDKHNKFYVIDKFYTINKFKSTVGKLKRSGNYVLFDSFAINLLKCDCVHFIGDTIVFVIGDTQFYYNVSDDEDINEIEDLLKIR